MYMVNGIRSALILFKKRPLRMGLTVLQVAVGVTAIMIVLSFVFSILDSTTDTDKEIFEVFYGEMRKDVDSNNTHLSRHHVFTEELLDNIKNKSNYIKELTIIDQDYRGFIDYKGIRYMYRRILGTGVDFLHLMDIKVKEGSFFSNSDIISNSRVIIISKEAKKQLFNEETAIGKTITWVKKEGDRTFKQDLKIIGVFDNDLDFSYERIHFIVPYNILKRYENYKYGMVWLTFKNKKTGEGKEEFISLFNHEYKKESKPVSVEKERQQEENMEIIFQEAINDNSNMSRDAVTRFGSFIGSFAFISFIISFTGVLSMMLVSIVERTREIGLRRALGANKFNIISQIVIESILISLLGGIAGLIIAYFAVEPVVEGIIFDKLLYYNNIKKSVVLSFYPVTIALGGVILVGLLAGIYPAIQAAELLPVEAINEK